jgi:acyl phosphate:glycerol-3-phosphate acyltransferase
MHPAVGLVPAYLLGSIPTAYLAGRMLKGIDLREHGSGNLGATNVSRVLGTKIGIAVLLLDGLKGAIPALFFPRMFAATASPTTAMLWALAYGAAAMLGHSRPIFLLWKGGGKGVATAGGMFIALAPIPMVITLTVWAIVLFVSGYMSLASLTAATVLPIALGFWYGIRSPLFWAAVLVALFIYWTHRSNIDRLRRGEEHRFGRKRTEAT